MKRFPSGPYGRQRLHFQPAPFKAPLRAFAVLVFAWKDGKVLICDIEDRGWCVPSGRVEAGEDSIQAAEREAMEEGGAILQDMLYMGCYRITERREVRWADCFVAGIKELKEFEVTVESLGRQLVSLDELPDIYHLWNPLTKMVFEHSYEIVERGKRLR